MFTTMLLGICLVATAILLTLLTLGRPRPGDLPLPYATIAIAAVAAGLVLFGVSLV